MWYNRGKVNCELNKGDKKMKTDLTALLPDGSCNYEL